MTHTQTHRPGTKTVREAVDAQSRALNHKARRLDRQRVRTTAIYWQQQGSQKMLREVARQLHAMRNLYNQYGSDYCLYKALVEYLECLSVVLEDVKEEAHLPAKDRHCTQIQVWKAQGEAYVLPRICTNLARLLQRYAPLKEDGYFLSPDGMHLVCFPTTDDEPVVSYRKERYSVC